MSRFGRELIESAIEALSIAKGGIKPVRIVGVEDIHIAANLPRVIDYAPEVADEPLARSPTMAA